MRSIKKIESDRVIGIWLMTGVGMLIIQIALGGITRLTGSGLSITEWDVITGVIPPLNTQQWLDEFHKYQQTPQYRYLNSAINLQHFKFIFFWEWFHRLWGRIIGFAFLIPFIIFIIQRRIKPYMIKPLVILFILGALQGAIGWIMVASGLIGDAIYVKPAKLAMHFVLACILISYTYWFALKTIVDEDQLVKNSRLQNFTKAIICIAFIQLIFGALMAGYKAAPAAPTWPDINGSFIPDYVFNRPEGWISVIQNPIVIHFIHRSIAYLLFVCIVLWLLQSFKTAGGYQFRVVRIIPALFIFIQICLGIATVLTSAWIRPTSWNIFEWMAELHQLTAIFLVLSLITALFYLQRK